MLLIALTFAVPWFFNITGLKQFVFSSNARAEPEPNFLGLGLKKFLSWFLIYLLRSKNAPDENWCRWV